MPFVLGDEVILHRTLEVTSSGTHIGILPVGSRGRIADHPLIADQPSDDLVNVRYYVNNWEVYTPVDYLYPVTRKD